MKNFRKKWVISASSGIFGKILLLILGFGVGIVGKQFFSVSIDKDIIAGAGFVVGLVVILFTVMICMEFPLILEWFAYKRESENEKLQLENENLKLKLELQKKQSQPDNNE